MIAKEYLEDINLAGEIRLGVGIILYNHKGILLEQRRDCGKWGLIGGRVEVGEQVEESIIRETLEETSFRIHTNEIRMLGVFSNPLHKRIIKYPDNIFHAIDIIYYLRLVENREPIISHESLNLSFFQPEKLPIDIVPPAIIPLKQFIRSIY
ncbi:MULTISPECIES: NUDIX domain-containing protein [unclassified Prochlorococcus]|uniref:NUDIX domain-containing protein n=1 Tax=unclassified Prochlorococcus TaxID=2627481 RepID=UPI000533A6EE|nr:MULTISPECIES: NUDIX domain-containing protein [unclassified Prochlorococcus]KGG16337.1 hypothetical protein EV07_1506 [Prochlorococcus sp. MIT 0603]KGG17929.1 hypothetical protein EV06_0052 [Prochlorococcus sp. MIT 0602]